MRKWTHVMVHHTAGQDDPGRCDAALYRAQHMAKGWLDIGYHFVVEKVSGQKGAYSVIVGRPLFMDGAHAGSTEWNTKSIGVALVGNFSEFPPTMEQQETAARLVRGLCEAMDIPVDREHIVGHREQRATECPGKWFNMDYFVDRVRAAK